MARLCAASGRLKTCYDTQEAAQQAVDDLRTTGTRRRAGHSGHKPQRVYECGDHWHFTSQATKPREIR
jgi:hypothetical protein